MFKYEITEDRTSTVVEMQISTAKGQILEKREVFLNPVQAQVFIQDHVHQYLVMKLRKLIMHCWHVGIGSHSDKYNKEERVQAMSFCLDFLRWMKHQNLHGIILWIRQNQKSLEMILPVMSNTSYQGSRNNLDEIIRLINQIKLN